MKKPLLFCVFFLVLLSCERDKVEPILQQKEETGLLLSKITLDELPSLILNKTNQAAQRSAHRFGPPRTDLPIYVSTNHKGYKSYTIALAKSSQAPNTSALYFDNRVVHLYQDGTRKAYVIRYEPTKKWYDSSLDFKNYSGEITFFTNYGHFINSITMQNGQVLETSRNNIAAKTSEICYLYLEKVVTICTDGGHIEGSKNGSGIQCKTTYYYELDCSGSNGGGGTGDAGETLPEPDLDQIPTGSGYTPPIIPEVIIDPCLEISKQLSNSGYMSKMSELRNNLNLHYETGFSQSKNGLFSHLSLSQGSNSSLDVNITPNTIGFMHVHNNDYTLPDINNDGIAKIIQSIKMPSPQDIKTFLMLVKNAAANGIPTSSVYVLVVSSNGNYSLRFTGNISDVNLSFNPKKLNPTYKSYFKRYLSDEKAFLKFLENEIQTPGIELYKIKDNGAVKKKFLNEKENVKSKKC